MSTTNVRSLRNALKLKPDGLYFEKSDLQLDILGITEVQGSFAKLESSSRFHKSCERFPFCFWNACTHPKRSSGYSGVGICCSVQPLRVLFDFLGDNPMLSEGRVITVYFEDIVVICVYSPATLTDGDPSRIEFDRKFVKHVVGIRTQSLVPVIIVGDMNVPPEERDVAASHIWLKQAREYITDRESFKTLLNLGELQDTTRGHGFTWHPEPHCYHQHAGVGQRLDVILIPQSWQVLKCQTRYRDNFSDHRPVLVFFQASPLPCAPEVGLRKMSELQAGVNTALFLKGDQEDENIFENVFKTCVSLHNSLGNEEVKGRENRSSDILRYNGTRQKRFQEITYPAEFENDSGVDMDISEENIVEPCVVNVEDKIVKYRNLLKDNGFEVRPRLSQYFLANNTTYPVVGIPLVVPSCAKVKLSTQHVYHVSLLDTGSDLCLIDDNFARKSIPMHASLFTAWPRNLILGDGDSRMQIVGFITVDIDFETKDLSHVSCSQVFFCVTKLKECIIIGDCFFSSDQRHNFADLSPRLREMTLKGQVIPYACRLLHVHLNTPRKIQIPGNSCILLQIRNSDISLGMHGHVFDKIFHPKVQVSKSEKPIEKGVITLKIKNLSKKTCTIEANIILGCYQCIQDAPQTEIESKDVSSLKRLCGNLDTNEMKKSQNRRHDELSHLLLCLGLSCIKPSVKSGTTDPECGLNDEEIFTLIPPTAVDKLSQGSCDNKDPELMAPYRNARIFPLDGTIDVGKELPFTPGCVQASKHTQPRSSVDKGTGTTTLSPAGTRKGTLINPSFLVGLPSRVPSGLSSDPSMQCDASTNVNTSLRHSAVANPDLDCGITNINLHPTTLEPNMIVAGNFQTPESLEELTGSMKNSIVTTRHTDSSEELPKPEVRLSLDNSNCTKLDPVSNDPQKKPDTLLSPLDIEIRELIQGWQTRENPASEKDRDDLNSKSYVPDSVKNVDFFDEKGDILQSLLPLYLKHWKLNLAQVSIKRESMNKFIQRVLIDIPNLDKVFVTDKSPGLANNIQIHVELTDLKPWYSRLRPLPPDDKKSLEKVVNTDLQNGVVEESLSDRAAGVILVRKRGGRDKVATNFKEFNEKTVTFPYPLPLLNDCLDSLAQARFLSSIDINGAYMSIEIPPIFRKFFAFICHLGLFQWTRLPYGWKNSGSFFYKCMAITFMSLIYVILCVYADDTFIFGGLNEDEHMACICITLLRCLKAGLHLDIDKCAFFAIKLEYLGFQAVLGGIQPLKRNVDKILKLEVQTVGDIRRFIGLANFYRRFVPNFAKAVRPLNAFLQKNAKLPKPVPTEVAEAIDFVKKTLTTYPVLLSPQMTKRFYLATDGSKQGLGAVLYQMGEKGLQPCAYASSAVLPSQACFSGPMLEALASVWAMLHFKHYLKGEFTLITDNVVLKWLKCKKIGLGAMTKWVIESQSFDFIIQHEPGKSLHGPDLLSRGGARAAEICKLVEDLDERTYSYAATAVEKGVPDIPSMPPVWTSCLPTDKPRELCRQDWIQAQKECSKLQELVRNQPKLFELRKELWYFTYNTSQPRVVVPLSLRAPVLMLVHGLLGHRGSKPIEKWMARILYWISAPLENETEKMTLRRFVRRWIRACTDCNRRKMLVIAQPALIPARITRKERAFRKLGIDWMGREFPVSSEGFKYLLTVMCDWTSFCVPICLKTNEPAEIGEALFKEFFSIFGFPEVIHSDNDVRLNTAMDYIFAKFGIQSTKILPRHPEQNSRCERWHRYVNASLTIILPRYNKWPQMVHICALAYRALPHETNGFSPYFLVFGTDMVLPLEASLGIEEDIDIFEGDAGNPEKIKTTDLPEEVKRQIEFTNTVNYVNDMARTLQAAFKLVRRSRFVRTLKNQEASRKPFKISFQVGDTVYLKEPSASSLQGKMRTSVLYPDTVPQKWKFLWSGPHVISAIHKNPNKYTLIDSGSSKERLAHVSDLRKHIPFSNTVFDTSCPTRCESYSPTPEGFTLWSTEDGKAAPKVGDICLARIREFAPEDICVLELLGNGVFQWYSNPLSRPQANKRVRNLTSFELFKRTCFLPGWDRDENSVDYLKLEKGEMRNPFTVPAEDVLPYIFIWGLKIQNNGNFKADTLMWIEQECQRQDEEETKIQRQALVQVAPIPKTRSCGTLAEERI
jgi:exonuclease III